MIEQIKKMRERIMTHQETNGFETIYDFLNEDLDELEKLAKDSGDIHIVSQRSEQLKTVDELHELSNNLTRLISKL